MKCWKNVKVGANQQMNTACESNKKGPEREKEADSGSIFCMEYLC